MRLQALSLLALFSGIAYAGPWALTTSPTRKPFYFSSMVLDGPLFHAFRGSDPNDPGLVQLYELVFWEEYDHIYTTSQAEVDALDPPRPGGRGRVCGEAFGKKCDFWVRGTEYIYAWTAEAPGRVPLHRFFDGKFHFYTLGLDEGQNAGFKYEGIAAWVLPGPVEGSTQVYRWRKQ